MITLETERVPWWWRWQMIRYRRTVAVGEGIGDVTGYVRFIAIDYRGNRQQVGQPVHPSQARRVLSEYEDELRTMAEVDWVKKHRLGRLHPTPAGGGGVRQQPG